MCMFFFLSFPSFSFFFFLHSSTYSFPFAVVLVSVMRGVHVLLQVSVYSARYAQVGAVRG